MDIRYLPDISRVTLPSFLNRGTSDKLLCDRSKKLKLYKLTKDLFSKLTIPFEDKFKHETIVCLENSPTTLFI